jgi:hypothetical protein
MSDPDVNPLRVPVPTQRTGNASGLGEVLKRLTTAFGVRPCAGCARRAEALNHRVIFSPAALKAEGPPLPKSGCWFAGTNCYGFVQTLKFCCNDGAEYTERYGWCIGVWFAPPCRFPVPRNNGTRALAGALAGLMVAARWMTMRSGSRKGSFAAER